MDRFDNRRDMPSTFKLNHLATYSSESGVTTPEDGLRLLCEMDSKITAMRCDMIIEHEHLIVIDKGNGEELERFQLKNVHKPISINEGTREMYTNLIMFTTIENPEKYNYRSDMHIFQSISAPAQDIVDTLLSAKEDRQQVFASSISQPLIISASAPDLSEGAPCYSQPMNISPCTVAHSVQTENIERDANITQRNSHIEYWHNGINKIYKDELRRKNVKVYEAVRRRIGRNSKEITIDEGDVLEVLNDSKKWWLLRNYKGDTGYAPFTIIKEATDDHDDSIPNITLINSDDEFWHIGVNQLYKDELRRKNLKVYVALHSKTGRNSMEITIDEGDVLEVLDDSRNWWKLRNYKGDTGYAPFTDIEEARDDHDDIIRNIIDGNSYDEIGKTRENQIYKDKLRRQNVKVYEAVHRRIGINRKEITIDEGDVFEVLDDSRNWWKLRNYKGDTGYAPFALIEEARDDHDDSIRMELDAPTPSSVSDRKTTDNSETSSLPNARESIDKDDTNIQLPWLVDGDEFHNMLSRGEFLSYENRLSLGGPCKAGKSTLASVLIGEDIPLKWNSTDGLVIFFGKNGIDIANRKMVPLKEGERGHEVLAKVLRGNPDVSKTGQMSEHFTRTSRTKIHPKIQTIIETYQPSSRDTIESHATIDLTEQSVTELDNYLSLTEPEYEQKSTSTRKKDISSNNEEIQALEFKKLQLQSDILEEIRNGQYSIKIAPSDLVDFGGQKSYDMTHQLFIQHSGSFLLMFDGRYGLNTQLSEYPEGVTAASILKHWVDSILTYTEDTKDIMPMILFAATHRDQCKEDTETLRKSFMRDIKEMFSHHEKQSHIHLDVVYFINGIDKNDAEIQRMTEQVVAFAMRQSSWGQRRPMQWVPLELQISNMKMKNVNIIRKEDLRIVNNLNGDLALNASQMDDFLLVQHSLGKLMYYNLPGLDQFIIVHPPAMVNILRSFVTDEKFFPQNHSLRSILQKMTDTGILHKTDLLKLWQQDHFNQYMPENATQEFVLQLLIHLDILIVPKTFKQNPFAAVVYIVPCMIKAIRPSHFSSLDCQGDKTICLRYSLQSHSVPTSLAFRVIGATVNAWPLKYESQTPCLYHKAAVLNVSEDNEVRIWLDSNRAMVYLTNQDSLLSISPDVAASVQECLTKNIELSLLFHYNSFGRKMKQKRISKLYTIEVGIPCGSDVCFLSAEEVMKNDRWICEKGKQHETRYLRYWFFNKSLSTCGPTCEGLNEDELRREPSDKHLVRLGGHIGIHSFEEYLINLGMKKLKWESTLFMYAGHSPEGIMTMALKQWKDFKLSELECPTLKDLADALTAMDLSIHIICQVFREKTKLFEIANFDLQAIPTDHQLKQLTTRIGNCPLQLGIELGLGFPDVENSLVNFPKDLPGLIEDILAKWKRKSKVKTIHSLMLALQRVESGGVTYLCEISKL